MRFNRIQAIALRHIFLTMHQLERFSDLFIWPVVGLVMWGFLANYIQAQSSAIATFFLGGLIFWIIFERVGTGIGIDFMWDIWERNIINVLASPITLFEYIFSLVLVSLAKVVISFAAMIVLALVFYNFGVIGSFGFSLIAFWINLIFFAVVLGIFNISLVVRFGHIVGPLTWILPFVIQPFAAVFYPVEIFPEFVQKIVLLLPLAHVFEGMREVLTSHTFNIERALIAFGLNSIYFVLAVCFFTFMFNLTRKRGNLTKL